MSLNAAVYLFVLGWDGGVLGPSVHWGGAADVSSQFVFHSPKCHKVVSFRTRVRSSDNSRSS